MILTTVLIYGELADTNYLVINKILKGKICNKVVSCYLEYAWHMLLSEGSAVRTVSSAVGTASLSCRNKSGF